MSDRKVIGFYEEVTVVGKEKSEKVTARIDTGATKSSLDSRLAVKLKLGPVIEKKYIKNAHGAKLRPIINVEIELKGEKIKELFSVADRSHMKYPVLIGQNILKKGFIIDPLK